MNSEKIALRLKYLPMHCILIEHQDYGLVYQAIIKLDKDFLMINEKKIPLTAGMNVTAEIKIRERRVIDYFLSPLQTKVDESMREL